MKTRKNFLKVLFTFIAIFLPWIIAVTLLDDSGKKGYIKVDHFKEIDYKIDTIQK